MNQTVSPRYVAETADKWLFLAKSGYGPSKSASIMGVTVGAAIKSLETANHTLSKPLRERLWEGRRRVAAEEVGLDCVDMPASPATKKQTWKAKQHVDLAGKYPHMVVDFGMRIEETLIQPTQLSRCVIDDVSANIAERRSDRAAATSAKAAKALDEAGESYP